MNIKLLETFVCAARMRNFSAAASQLGISQPSVSLRIQELEKLLGTPVLERKSREIKLTAKGRELLGYAERICKLFDELLICAGDPNEKSGSVQLGITETIALTWLPSLVLELNRQFPKVVFDMNVGLTEQVWKWLEGGELEIALLAGPAARPNVRSFPLGCVSYEWIASPLLIEPGERPLSPSRLASYPILSLSRDSVLFNLIDDWFVGGGCDVPKKELCNSLSTMAHMTKAGLGVSLLPSMIFAEDIATGSLKVLKTTKELDPIDFHAVYFRSSESVFARKVMDIAGETSSFQKC